MPSSALPGCYSARNLVAVRASRLNADGTRICPNTDGSAYSVGGVTSFTSTAIVDSGTTDTDRDGDGNICSTLTNPDVVTGRRGVLTLCRLDLQMIELLTGANPLLSGGTFIGFEEPDPDDTPPLVEFHWWAKAWSGSGQAASPYNYVHGALFATQWRLGDMTFQNGALSFPISYTAAANESIVIGSFDDIPPLVFGTGFAALWLASDVPSTTASPYNVNGLSCGYVDTPACSAS